MTCLPSRLAAFRTAVSEAFSTEHAQSMPVGRVTQLVNTGRPDNPFSANEITAGLNTMEEANQVMVSEGVVFLI